MHRGDRFAIRRGAYGALIVIVQVIGDPVKLAFGIGNVTDLVSPLRLQCLVRYQQTLAVRHPVGGCDRTGIVADQRLLASCDFDALQPWPGGLIDRHDRNHLPVRRPRRRPPKETRVLACGQPLLARAIRIGKHHPARPARRVIATESETLAIGREIRPAVNIRQDEPRRAAEHWRLEQISDAWAVLVSPGEIEIIAVW